MKPRTDYKADFKVVFSSPEGKRVLAKICSDGFLFRPTFTAGEPHQTALNEGARRLALSILKTVMTTPRQLQEFAEEHIDQQYQ